MSYCMTCHGFHQGACEEFTRAQRLGELVDDLEADIDFQRERAEKAEETLGIKHPKPEEPTPASDPIKVGGASGDCRWCDGPAVDPCSCPCHKRGAVVLHRGWSVAMWPKCEERPGEPLCRRCGHLKVSHVGGLLGGVCIFDGCAFYDVEEPTPAKPEKRVYMEPFTDPETGEVLHRRVAKPEASKPNPSLESARALGEAIRALATEKERAEKAEACLLARDHSVKVLREQVARLQVLVSDCEREHPPEPEYLAWQQAGKPDAVEVTRLREVLGRIETEITVREPKDWSPREHRIVRLCREAKGGSDAKAE